MNYLDGYCERLEPGLWAEPLNALSNLAFILAAAVLWFRYHPEPKSLRALVVLLLGIGLGSLSFHTFANGLTQWFDVVFIALFVLWYLVCFGHWFVGLSWAKSWLFVPGLAVLVVLLIPVSALIPNESGQYLGPCVAVFGLAAALRFGPAETRRHWRAFGIAGVVFAVSLTLRTLDPSVCSGFPVGTHFLWHLLNAVVLYLVAREAMLRVSRPR